MKIYTEITDCIRHGHSNEIRQLIRQARSDNIPAPDILKKGLIPGMQIISDLFRNNEIYIPEVLVATGAMDAALEILRPELTHYDGSYIATVVIGTVKGDLHTIGKDLVAIMLEGAGFQVIDLGMDVSPEVFVERGINHSADIVAISALLTTTMQMMKYTVEIVQDSPLRTKVKTLIGGAPVTERFAKLIGADGYAEDAVAAITVCRQLLEMDQRQNKLSSNYPCEDY